MLSVVPLKFHVNVAVIERTMVFASLLQLIPLVCGLIYFFLSFTNLTFKRSLNSAICTYCSAEPHRAEMLCKWFVFLNTGYALTN